MDFKQIQELIKLINKSNIGELSIEENDFKITIKQKKEPGGGSSAVFSQQSPSNFQPLTLPSQLASQPLQVSAPASSSSEAASETKSENYVTIKSPMIGTFYRSPSP